MGSYVGVNRRLCEQSSPEDDKSSNDDEDGKPEDDDGEEDDEDNKPEDDDDKPEDDDEHYKPEQCIIVYPKVYSVSEKCI